MLLCPRNAAKRTMFSGTKIKANENCLNQNFSALAQKIYEFEARIALLEAAAASNAGKTDTGVESSGI